MPGRSGGGERAEGPLAREWAAVGNEVALGVPLARRSGSSPLRLPQPEVRAFVAALGRAARHGAPLAETLEAQARAARFALSRRIGRTPPGRGRRSSWWWRSCSCRPSCCSWRRRWRRRCAAGGADACRSRELPRRTPSCTQSPLHRTLHPKRGDWAEAPGLRAAHHRVHRAPEALAKRNSGASSRRRCASIGQKGGESCCRVGDSGVRWPQQSTGVAGLLPLRHSGPNSSPGI